MKQHITPNQATEVSVEQFYKLFVNQHWGIVRRKDWAHFYHKKVTIGKMIEVLEEDYSEWYAIIFYADYDGDLHKRYKGELCDALWNEIKRMLAYDKN